MSITFTHITTNDEGIIDKEWEKCVEETNELLVVAFGKGNDPYLWGATRIVKGCIDDKLVCTCGLKYWWKDNTLAFIDSVGAFPQNRGYGSLLMRYIVEYLNNSGVKKIYLKIDKNEKADRLKKFYSQFGFSEVNEVNRDIAIFIDYKAHDEYDDDEYDDDDFHDEYIMSRSGSVNSV